MENPFNHHRTHHHHHQRNNDEDDQEFRTNQYYPPPETAPPPPPYVTENEFPPKPYYQENEFPPQPRPYHQEPQVFHSSHNQQHEFPPPPKPYYQEPQVFHTSHNQQHEFPPPPRPYYQENEFPPQQKPYYQETQVFHTSHDEENEFPEPTKVVHVSHEENESDHSFKPHLPSFFHHASSESGSGSRLDFSNKPTYKVYSKAEPNFHLTIRDGKVVLAPSNPSDQFQNWYKDEKYSTRVKDEEGFPCFALVNKATGQAMKHSIGATHPVQLIPYNPDFLDESVLWTESKDLGDGFRAVRMVNNIRLNVDAFHGDKKSGGVHDGTTIVLWQWNKGDNQRWRITPHCKFLSLRAVRFLVSAQFITISNMIID